MNSSLSVDLSGCWLDEHGITKLQFAELANRLEAVRDETVLTDVKLLQSESIPVEKVPLDEGSINYRNGYSGSMPRIDGEVS